MPTEPNPPTPAAKPANAPLTAMLVVDDTQPIRHHLANLLTTRCDARVVQAENGVQALKALREQTFDLVVTDVNMPLLDGLKLTAMVRQDPTHHEVPILVMTTQASDADRAHAMRMGATDYVVKPAQDDEVVRRVKVLLKTP